MIFFLAGSRVVSWVGPQWKYSSPLPHITCIICLRNVNLAVTGEQDFISKTNFRLHISDYRFYLNIGRSHQWWLRMEQVWVLYSALREFKNVDTDDKFYRVFTSSVTRRSRLSSCLFQLIPAFTVLSLQLSSDGWKWKPGQIFCHPNYSFEGNKTTKFRS